MSNPPTEVTELLRSWSQGDPAALERMMPLVADDLRRIAQRYFAGEPVDHTLQPTALVNEVYLKLVDQQHGQWQNRAQFFAVSAILMRRILVDYAKRRRAGKRGGGLPKIPLDDVLGLAAKQQLDLLDLDAALTRLAELDPRQAQIVVMRFFAGLDNDEIAEALGISVSTVKREWRTARLWLFRELGGRVEPEE
jgi:RNA polymerase sigma-70 factor, ECF subfamily